MDPRPTLLVFTLGAERERERRPLLPAPLGAAEVDLRRACLDAALAAGRAAGCRLVVAGPPGLAVPAGAERVVQRGAGFGERLANAVADAAGGGPLVVVGSDCPGLAAAHLRRCLAALAAEPRAVVAGPSPDGGFYLLAFRAPLAGLAGRARWCGRHALADLAASVAADGRPLATLPPLADLDRPADLARWLRWTRRAARAAPTAPALLLVARRLGRLLAALCRVAGAATAGGPRAALAGAPAGRAPPARPHPAG